MKILWINDAASFTGGAETYIYQSAHTLSQEYDVENILLYNVDNRVDYEYSKIFSFISVLADLEQQVSLIKPDIIYVHQVNNEQVLEKLSNLKIPVIGFIHDHKKFCLREHKYTTIGHTTCSKKVGLNCYTCLGFINKTDSFPYISVNTLSKINAVQETLKRFDHIIVASEYMKNHLILHNFNNEKISKILLFSNPLNSISYSNNITKKKCFLYVGQLVRGKGIDTLLDAIAKLNHHDNITLDICGDGKQQYALEQQAKNLGISHKVSFHGKIKPSDLSAYYLKAYAVVIPSRAPETFNLVGIEAMKYSKAVIAADVGGIREWLVDGITGQLFSSNDSSGLSKVIEEAAKNPQSISRMGQHGLEAYQKKFTSLQHCNTLYNIFCDLTQKEDFHVA
ncbi:MAG: glycosyltransferase family 4 protein [Sulfurimonas sp.]|nr:glycosyltransferase family 4 protein [Sulfurimonas sp.]